MWETVSYKRGPKAKAKRVLAASLLVMLMFVVIHPGHFTSHLFDR